MHFLLISGSPVKGIAITPLNNEGSGERHQTVPSYNMRPKGEDVKVHPICVHWTFSAWMGSTRAAWNAGIRQAASAALDKRTRANAKEVGSNGPTPYNCG